MRRETQFLGGVGWRFLPRRFANVSVVVVDVHLPPPGRAVEAFPARFVQDGDNAAAASYGLASRNLVDLRMLDWRGDALSAETRAAGIWTGRCPDRAE